MKSPRELSVVIPFYNEEACAAEVVEEMVSVLDKEGLDYELLLVNNGSEDRTGELLKGICAERPRLRLIQLKQNRGYGGAILAGLAAAEGRVLGFTCGDGQISPADLVRVYKVLASGQVHFCKAKRVGRQDGLLRQLWSFGYHVLVGILFRVHITDVNGYPVLMERGIFQRMRLKRENWIINVEILLAARRLGVAMAEVDVCHRDRMGGRSHVNWMTPLIFLAELMAFAWEIHRCRRRGAGRSLTRLET